MFKATCAQLRFALLLVIATFLSLLNLTANAADEFKGLGYSGLGTYNHAKGVSADGGVVVGELYNGKNWEAVRWSGGIMSKLGSLYGKTDCSASRSSKDGSVIVGSCSNGGTSNNSAFRWKGGIMTDLGMIGTKANCYANDVSSDGKVVVGMCRSGVNDGLDDYEAFR